MAASIAGTAGLATGLPSAAQLLAQEPATNARPGDGLRNEFALNIEMWFGKLPFVERIQAAADLGFKWVEFWPWRNKDLDAIAAMCEKTGVRVAQFTAWGFVPGLNHSKNHDRFEQHIIDACEAAQRITCPMATVVGGNDQRGMSTAEMHQNIIDGLKRVAPIVEAANLMLILEPMNIRVDHKGHCLYGSVDAVNICREVNSPMVKINWDLYHMQISEGDLCGRLEDGFDQVGYIQLADHPGRHEPGTGEIQYGRVFEKLIELGYRGPIGCECSPRDGDFVAAQRLAIADHWRSK